MYILAPVWGHGFITHADREEGKIECFPGDIHIVDDNMNRWVAKVNGERKTKSQAQALVNVEVEAAQATWDNNNVEGESSEEKIARLKARPPDITLY